MLLKRQLKKLHPFNRTVKEDRGEPILRGRITLKWINAQEIPHSDKWNGSGNREDIQPKDRRYGHLNCNDSCSVKGLIRFGRIAQESKGNIQFDAVSG